MSTTQGAVGTKAQHGGNILVADDPEAFAKGVARVLGDPDLRETLGRGGRKPAERFYSWNVIGVRQADLYRSVLEGRRA